MEILLTMNIHPTFRDWAAIVSATAFQAAIIGTVMLGACALPKNVNDSPHHLLSDHQEQGWGFEFEFELVTRGWAKNKLHTATRCHLA